MDLNSDVSRSLSMGYEAGEQALLDPALWRELARTALAPRVLWRAVAIFAAMAVAAMLAAWWLPPALSWLVPLAFALWLWPRILRWFISEVARNALRSVASRHRLELQPLPPESSYRAWWRPALICSAMHGPLLWLGLSDNALALLLLLGVQIVVVAPALVRSLAAPWLPLERIEESLRADPTGWRLFAAVGVVTLAALRGLASHLGGLDPVDLFGMFGSSGGVALLGIFAKFALTSAAGVFIGVFCTAAMARVALARILGDEEPVEGDTLPPALDALPPPPVAPQEPLLHRPSAARVRQVAIGALAAILLVAVLPSRARQPAIVWLLRADFQAADADGEWSSPSRLQGTRNLLACNGDTFKLRLMHWGGMDSLKGEDDTALACAAKHGHLATVKVLLALGDDPIARVHDPRFKDPATLLSPIAQALQSEKGLPSAEYILSQGHGAHMERPALGGVDGVQAAALSDCLACVEWAVRHHAPLDGTWQATPMTLWLDGAGRGSAQSASLMQLAALGLSATAAGEDGRTPLHAAANNGDLQSVEWLLQQGADPARVDRDGNTALLYAVARLGLGPNDRRIGQGSPADRDRVRVVQRLLAVTPSTEHAAPRRERHVVLAKVSPYVDDVIDFDAATEAYPELRQANGPSLPDLINPS